jgi:hypothetical protein
MKKFTAYIQQPVSIAPLAMFRVIFGVMMLISIIRFALNGWIYKLYVEPDFYFPYLGFEWIKPLGETGMYMIFLVMGITAFCIMTGLFYRVSAVLFFLSFTYVELIDKTNYLNHYYFVSIISFLLIILPAHRYFSIDAKIFPRIRCTEVPRWTIGAIMLQLGMVYFFAGLAKVNYDWLIEAQPLRIWLPANGHLPFFGSFLDEVWVAYFFSWFGCIYDLSIPFLLLNNKTRKYAYIAVIAFHVLTRLLFNIGMFPWIMILSTLIFFPSSFHQGIIDSVRKFFNVRTRENNVPRRVYFPSSGKIITGFLAIHFLIQVFLPLRYALYPGNLFWSEEGYRFSWRVMLMEKGGTAIFYVSDPAFPGEIEIDNCDYLTAFQEKMMSTQPDMILQFAHHIREDYTNKTIAVRDKQFTFKNPVVRVKSNVSLNGKGSRPFVDPATDLAQVKYDLAHRDWILPLE